MIKYRLQDLYHQGGRSGIYTTSEFLCEIIFWRFSSLVAWEKISSKVSFFDEKVSTLLHHWKSVYIVWDVFEALFQ